MLPSPRITVGRPHLPQNDALTNPFHTDAKRRVLSPSAALAQRTATNSIPNSRTPSEPTRLIAALGNPQTADLP
jgi:hypothetical protein